MRSPDIMNVLGWAQEYATDQFNRGAPECRPTYTEALKRGRAWAYAAMVQTEHGPTSEYPDFLAWQHLYRDLRAAVWALDTLP